MGIKKPRLLCQLCELQIGLGKETSQGDTEIVWMRAQCELDQSGSKGKREKRIDMWHLFGKMCPGTPASSLSYNMPETFTPFSPLRLSIFFGLPCLTFKVPYQMSFSSFIFLLNIPLVLFSEFLKQVITVQFSFFRFCLLTYRSPRSLTATSCTLYPHLHGTWQSSSSIINGQ